ncbi:I78 family peptidase inhibitor [Pseudoxanthomonas sp. 10H]|uniref:I78 family peptidase inhibitor n=1 Tax=Pseudoxanthomonas sp. 10H TaxID=3242729 RepID=UPI0035582087
MRTDPIRLPAAIVLLLTLAACSAGGSPEDDGAEQEQAITAAQQAAESAAAPPAEGTAEAAPPAPTCDASQVQGLVGQKADDAVAEQARGDAGARHVRLLKPGQMVTMEFNGERLNLEVDAAGTITSVRCG